MTDWAVIIIVCVIAVAAAWILIRHTRKGQSEMRD
jgi:ribose/xylose/arabinose/galactoside ABC-type transport system permease subunit